MKNWLLFLFVLLLFCQQKNLDFGSGNIFTVEKNLHYGETKREVLDLYSPQKAAENPLVFIFVHGGGWKGGDKSSFQSFMQELMRSSPGNYFANMNYTLASNAQFAIPAQTDDIQKVIAFLDMKLKNQSAKKYILVGASSGAHISMLYAYHFDKKKQVKTVVNIVGPADLSSGKFSSYPEYRFVEKRLIDPKIVPENIPKEDFASPVYWISTAVPTVSFYGNGDTVVPVEQKSLLDSAFQGTAIRNYSFTFPGNHTDFEKDSNKKQIVKEILAFIGKPD